MSETIAGLLLDRLGDDHPGLLSRDRSRTRDEVVHESAARAELARALRVDGPFHIGVLLENVPEFILWLGGAALAGASIVGINNTRSGAHLEEEVRNTELQLVITDTAGLALLDGLDIGLSRDRFLLVDDPAYGDRVAKHACEPTRGPHDRCDHAAAAALHLRHHRRLQGGPLQPGTTPGARPDERREVRRAAR
ncbi:hypothetical protein [Nocardioides sp. B-3]|uniref:hypothetical protein n=1 Tax=Nocardioides sp. B-3 TaxID=2895565 RepID=UPI002152A709|nr:hypothetical protein [Nocardioides sp. B-3]UUZ59399.1 hypothetical protein LP418_26955 [Nocardioides sp. B-3]